MRSWKETGGDKYECVLIGVSFLLAVVVQIGSFDVPVMMTLLTMSCVSLIGAMLRRILLLFGKGETQNKNKWFSTFRNLSIMIYLSTLFLDKALNTESIAVMIGAYLLMALCFLVGVLDVLECMKKVKE